MTEVTLQSRAKINLMLAVTGKRPDGFHDLISVVAATGVADTLRVRTAGAPGTLSLDCSYPGVPTGPENLVCRAVEAFREKTGYDVGLRVELEKRVPPGAGFGGGSGNAAAMLLALNDLAGRPLERSQLAELAAGLGSDVPLFLETGPLVIRGRGERVETLSGMGNDQLADIPVRLFKPSFGVDTGWAYHALSQLGNYTPVHTAEVNVKLFKTDHDYRRWPVHNDFQPVVFAKYFVLPVLFARLRMEAGEGVFLLSGSGSGCFQMGGDGASAVRIIQEALGADAFLEETHLEREFCVVE